MKEFLEKNHLSIILFLIVVVIGSFIYLDQKVNSINKDVSRNRDEISHKFNNTQKAPYQLYNEAVKCYKDSLDATCAINLLRNIIDSFPESPYSREAKSFIDTIKSEDYLLFEKRLIKYDTLKLKEKIANLSYIASDKKWFVEVRNQAFDLKMDGEKELILNMYSSPKDKLEEEIEVLIKESWLSDLSSELLQNELSIINKVNCVGKTNPISELSSQYGKNPVVANDNYVGNYFEASGKITKIKDSDLGNLLKQISKNLKLDIPLSGGLITLKEANNEFIFQIDDRELIKNLVIGQEVRLCGIYDGDLLSNEILWNELRRLTGWRDIGKVSEPQLARPLFLLRAKILDGRYGLTVSDHLNRIRLILLNSEIIEKTEFINNIEAIYRLSSKEIAEEYYKYLLHNGVLPWQENNPEFNKLAKKDYSLVGNWTSTSGYKFEVYKDADEFHYKNVENDWVIILSKLKRNIYEAKKYVKRRNDIPRDEKINFVVLSDNLVINYYNNYGNFNVWRRTEIE